VNNKEKEALGYIAGVMALVVVLPYWAAITVVGLVMGLLLVARREL